MNSSFILFIIMMQQTSFILLLLIIFTKINALKVVKYTNTSEEQDVNIPNDARVDLAEQALGEKSDENLLNKVPDSEIVETAESDNYVYRPLYVYKKIEHSKRRINMYNAFAG